MKERGLRFLKTDLFKTSFWNGIATVIKMAVGLVSNKIVAVYLGPSGIALIGQFGNFIGMASAIASMGVSGGITKYIAEYHNNEAKRKQIISTGLKTIIFGTLITSIITFIGAKYFCQTILHSQEYVSIFYIFSVTLFLSTLNGFLMSILNGYKEFKKIIAVNVLSSFVGLAIAIVLVIRYGVYGALLGGLLSVTVIVTVTLLFVIKSPWFKINNFKAAFDFSAFRNLSKFTLMAFTSMFAVTYIQLLVRTYIINHLSIEEAGYWQGVVKISDIYLSIITTTLGIYYLPRLSEIKENKELRREILKGYKFLLPLAIVSSLVIYLLRGFIIDVLFAPSFQPMKQLFLFQLLGNVFKIASWLLAFLMLAKAMTKTFIITEIVFGLAFYGLTVLFLDKYGTIGVTMAYCLNYFVYLIVMVFIFRKILIK